MNEREQDVDLDLEKTFKTLREFVGRVLALALRSLQHWPAMVLASMAGVGAAYMAPKLMKPVYETQAVLQYKEPVRTQVLVGGNQQGETWNQRSTSLRDMLTSRSNITALITELDLYPDVVAQEGMLKAVDHFRQDLSIGIRDGRTMVLSFRANDTKTPMSVVEVLIEKLKRQPNVDAAEQAVSTKKFLENQLAEVEGELAAKESALAVFASRHPEFAEAGIGLTAIGALTRNDQAAPAPARAAGGTRLAALRRQRAQLQQQLGQAVTPDPQPQAAPEISPEDRRRLNTAEQALARAQTELRDRLERYTDKHPDVIAAQKQVSQAQAKLEQVRASLTRPPPPPAPPSNDADRQELEKQLKTIERAIDAEMHSVARGAAPAAAEPTADPKADRAAGLEAQWVALNREVQAARTQHEQIQQRLFSASTMESIQSSGAAGQIVVIDPPLEPKLPTARGPRRTAAMAFVGVASIGFLVAFLLALIDDRLYDSYDVRSLKIGPIAHVTPPYRTVKARGGSGD